MHPLAAPARFFPLSHGRYDVAAGLKPLGFPYGNGPADSRTFLIDRNHAHSLDIKRAARAERLEKYYPRPVGLDPDAETAVIRHIATTLVKEYPEYFQISPIRAGHRFLARLTGDELTFNAQFQLIDQRTPADPQYRDALDALAAQIQEDLAIWKRDPIQQKEWPASVHLALPNHWAAEEKVGQPFNAVHAPVADFQKLARGAPGLVEMMISKGPFVRFAWGVATDRDLNHHPHNLHQGRKFDPTQPELHLRVERQTLTPFPEVEASLFTIQTSFLDCAKDLSGTERDALISALGSMSPDALKYKGLTETRSQIIPWLEKLPL